MAKKSAHNPNQLSLFDVFTQQIQELRVVNTQENLTLEEALYGFGNTNSATRHSAQVTQSGNNQSYLQSRKSHQPTLFDLGQMGAQQSREVIGTTSTGQIPLSTTFDQSMGDGGESAGIGRILRDGTAGNEPLGDLSGNGSGNRTNIVTEMNTTVIPQNYTITDEDKLGQGGAKVKYSDNINAIKLLHDLRALGKDTFATLEEQKILVKYVGWGGLPQVFDKDNEAWTKEYTELKELLSEEDYTNARRSTQDAHYTSQSIINAMYNGLERLGIANSQEPLSIIEPSAGIGNFVGLKPERIKSHFYTVEQDTISANILEYLYPQEHNIKASYQDLAFGKSIFDVALGNPPFGQQKLFDKDFPELAHMSIHNYFIAKSMDLVKEGGLGAFVVSRYFMDAQNTEHREHIAQNNHFLGAIRLPHDAFKENALTEVTTDIVFFQKKTAEEKRLNMDKGYDWVSLQEKEFYDQQTQSKKIGAINTYFAQNPRQIIGKMEFVRAQFADELKCININKLELNAELQKALSILPENIFAQTTKSQEVEKKNADSIEKECIQSKYYHDLKAGSFIVLPRLRKIMRKEKDAFVQDSLASVSIKSENSFNRIASMIEVRDTLRTLLNMEKTNAEQKELDKQREQLNNKYDFFVKKYGYLNTQTNRALFKDDPESSLLQSLEVNFEKGISKEQAKKTGKAFKEASARKATIFTQRVLEYAEPAVSAESVFHALSISLRETGTVNFERISSLLSKSQEEIQADLENENLIFKNPISQEWEIKDKYLSGNVKEKLKTAKAFVAMNPQYERNIQALEEVIPKDIEAVDIGVRFGSTWLPSEVISDFVTEVIGSVNPFGKRLQYIPAIGKWDVKLEIYDRTINTEVWGTSEYPANELIKSLLGNRAIKVEKEVGRDTNNKPIMQIDQDATDVATEKAEKIQQAFQDWIWQDDARREQLTRLYNDTFNTHVTPQYDGSHIELVGANPNVQLRKHQKDAIWRSIQDGTALFDHVVGAGKTMAAIGSIMESKRMGFIKKPMIVVPNHLLYSWRDESYKLYPDANLLVAEKSDFLKENRERFFSKVATGNWDAIIVAHSSFKKIDMPRETQEEILQEQIDGVTEAIEASAGQNNRNTVKQLEKQKERMENQFQKLLASNGEKDTSVDFSDLGVDALYVDEAHEYKNLSFASSMQVSGLGNTAGSAKALDLFVKCRYLQKQNGGKGVYFLTGTPISNTIAEVFTMQRYMQYEALKEKQIDYFDAWASTFGKVTNTWELDSTGVNYKIKERFANFENVPELLSMYTSFADVVSKDDIDEQLKKENKKSLTPSIKGGKPINHVIERSMLQASYMDNIIHRMEHLPADPRQDNPLKITNDARKAGLDYRLIDPSAPDFTETKVNVCADHVFELWQKSEQDKGTQLVFCDLSTPKGSKGVMENTTQNKLQNVENDLPDSTEDENFDMIDMDDILAGLSTTNFSVYDDLKAKLIKKGIPRHEIAFIHDANTDLRKSQLFSDVNKGNVRVLIGSTAKMGAGMNVQERLIAAHHLEAPWRPSDLSQRNGRIIRQGNKLYEKDPSFEVEIHYYATKQTYDARMWQTIEYKATAIEQFRKGDVLQRTIEDVQSGASNAAEMKAAASGNPLILMEVNLNAEKRKLEALFLQHERSKHRLKDRLKFLQNSDVRFEKAKTTYEKNKDLRDRNTYKEIDKAGKEKNKLEFFAQGKLLTAEHAEDLRSLFASKAKEAMQNKNAFIEFGRYRGFNISVHYKSLVSNNAEKLGTKDGFQVIVENQLEHKYAPQNLSYAYDDKISLTGIFQRMNNFLEKGFEDDFLKDNGQYERDQAEIPHVERELAKEFEKNDELMLVRENHSAVLKELKRMQEDKEYVSEWTPKGLEVFQAEKKSTLLRVHKDNKNNVECVKASITL